MRSEIFTAVIFMNTTPARRLWLLRPIEELPEDIDPWCPWYDKTFGFVVRADTEEKARQIANDNGGAEVNELMTGWNRTGAKPWLNPKESTCVELTADGEEGVIIEDVHSA